MKYILMFLMLSLFSVSSFSQDFESENPAELPLAPVKFGDTEVKHPDACGDCKSHNRSSRADEVNAQLLSRCQLEWKLLDVLNGDPRLPESIPVAHDRLMRQCDQLAGARNSNKEKSTR
jgi:hypothetical protein